jgi:hypothetical protein
LGLSASPALAQPSLVHVAEPQVSVLRLLPGDWLGPFPAPPGQCYDGYLEWFIYSTGSYTSTWNSYPAYGNGGCGGATAYGRWTARNGVLVFHQQSVPGCGTCTQSENIPLYYRFLTVNAVRLCDYPDAADGCWVYYRQRA